MIIDIHAHPSDMQSAQYLAPYFQQSATERHLLDGTPVIRGGLILSPEQYIKEMDDAGVDKTAMLNASVIPDTHIYEQYLKPKFLKVLPNGFVIFQQALFKKLKTDVNSGAVKA